MTLSDRQSASSRQGHEFEAMGETWLKIKEPINVIARRWVHPEVLVEVDLVVIHLTLGEVWIEFKGSWESPTANGLERTDTLKKAIANAYLLRQVENRRPYWLVCSHAPRAGTRGAVWLERAGPLFDRVICP